MKFPHTRLSVVLLCALMPTLVSAQVINVFNNSTTTWTDPTAWTPAGPPGSVDTAQFHWLGTTGGVLNQPVLNSSTTISQIALSNNSHGGGWSLTGTGTLTAGAATVSGLVTRGVGTHVIELGDGTATSLSLTGSTGTTLNGAFNIGHGSTVTLIGNTVAALSGTSNLSLRGGSLILDNTAGNPANQRLTGTGNVNVLGGGSTIEFRSAAAGSDFNGLSGALSLGGGDGTVRVNQAGIGPLNITFGSLVRSQTSATINVLNVGNGTLGAGGANDPTLKFITTPNLTNGVISNANGSTALGFAIFNNNDFASYDAANGVIPITSTPVSGALVTASTQNSRLTGDATISGTVAYNTLKIAPTASGQSLTISAGGVLSTLPVLLTGSNDYTITGGTLGNSNATRYYYVIEPETSLLVGSNLAVSSPINKAGAGYLVLTGTTNQVAFTSTQNVNLNGGTLRVTSTNFNMLTANAPTVRFRGGVLEYDVSAASITLARNVGTGAATLNWAASATSNSVGSGGFSAFSTDPANSLTVNLSSGATLTWGGSTGADANFVQDGHALIFGSTKSNATVIWTNPLNLDSGAAGAYFAREISVIGGVGNAADKTQMTGVIAGSTTTDLIKTGTGVLELTANNTYAGNTQVNGGTLLVTGVVAPSVGFSVTSNVFVHPAGTLGGTGTIGSATSNVNVFAAGILAPGSSPGTLTVHGNLTFTTTATYAVELGGTGAGAFDQTEVNGSVALGNATLTPSLINGFTPVSGDQLFIIVNDAADAVTGTFNGIAQGGTVTFDGYSAQVSYVGDLATNAVTGGNDVVLFNFTSVGVPELGSLALVGLALAALVAGRTLRRRPTEVVVDTAKEAAAT